MKHISITKLLIFAVSIIIAVIVLACGGGGSSEKNSATISWPQTSLAQSIKPGETTTKTLALTATRCFLLIVPD
ncbi:MAG: hypothetical protein AB3X44_11010 [Leptothrix sp. (in: b-proteobacteria)]